MSPTEELASVLRPLPHFWGTRDAAGPAVRLEAVKKAARRFREDFLKGAPVPYYRSFDLIRVPYPTRYALRDACSVPVPFIHIVNRMIVVQFKTGGGLKTLLVGPSDYKASGETPYFKRLRVGMGPFEAALAPILAPESGTVDHWLGEIGLAPEKVDFITYDHLHTQDVRRWFGVGEKTGYFPNAKLLIMRQEWESLGALLPPQLEWYCPHGVDGLHPSRVVLLDEDTALGEGVALIRTSGHTEGNHSIVVHTPEGPLVTSENGVSPDCYAPRHSRIPGVARSMAGRGGHVVNVASLAALAPIPGLALYSASKHAVRAFSIAAAEELAPAGIAVTVVCPDAVATPMLDIQVDDPSAALTFSGGRVLTAGEVAELLAGRVLDERPIEIALPASRAWLARAASLAPGLAAWLRPWLERRGRERQKALQREASQ